MIQGTKVGLSISARHMPPRFRLTVNSRTSADVRTELFPPLVTLRLFPLSYTVSLRDRVHRMRHPGETDSNATSVVTGCFNFISDDS